MGGAGGSGYRSNRSLCLTAEQLQIGGCVDCEPRCVPVPDVPNGVCMFNVVVPELLGLWEAFSMKGSS